MPATTDLSAKLASLFNNPKDSDITIEDAQGNQYHAHLNILGLHTNFFHSGFTDAPSRVFKFPEHGTLEVTAFLKYCYCGTSSLDSLDSNRFAHRISLMLYHLADYVHAEELKEIAAENFAKLVQQPLEQLADEKLEFYWEQELPSVTEEVFRCAETHGPLRIAIKDAVSYGITAKRMSWLPFHAAVMKHSDFAVMVMHKCIPTPAKEKKVEKPKKPVARRFMEPDEGFVACPKVECNKLLYVDNLSVNGMNMAICPGCLEELMIGE